jgi:GT2 family glycosyltransferase
VVWTHDRVDVAADCVRAVLAQSHAPAHTVVVDIASPDRSGARLAAEFGAAVRVVTLPENLGPGAAIRSAIDIVADLDIEHVWLVEDDSRPGPDCLAQLVDILARQARPAMVGPDGATMHWGQWNVLARLPPGASRPVEFVYLDGALIDADALTLTAPPRTDYFLMLVDVEYPLRLAAAGVTMVQAGVAYDALRLGAASGGEWRSYYQTRNHLHLALSRRSPSLLGGFVLRTLRQTAHGVRTRSWTRLRLRARGVADALRGRMGRTIEP